MQVAGGVKKRRRRNIVKVTGLTTVPYDPDEDQVRGPDFYHRYKRQSIYEGANHTPTFLSKNQYSHSGKRVTRSPSFDRQFLTSLSTDTCDEGTDKVDEKINSKKEKENELFDEESRLKHKYLLDQGFCNRIGQIILLGGISFTFPWTWKKKYCRIERWKPAFRELWKIVWFLMTIQTLVICVYQFKVFLDLVKEAKSYRQVFKLTFSVYWPVCAAYYNVNLYLYKDDILLYINSMFEMNRMLTERYVLTLKGHSFRGWVLNNAAIPINMTQPIISAFFFVINAGQPWFMYSYIHHKDNPWYFLLPGIVHEFVLVGQVITNCVMIAWLVMAHSNVCSFWLEEMHKNKRSEFTKDVLRESKTAIETYRSLQVLCGLFNTSVCPLGLPMMKFAIISGIIPCGYVLIRSVNHYFWEEFPGILTYPVGFFAICVETYAICAMAAEMFDLSCGFLETWSNTRNMEFRILLKSLPALRVKVGSWYAISTSTTKTFFYVMFNYITDAIITFP